MHAPVSIVRVARGDCESILERGEARPLSLSLSLSGEVNGAGFAED